MRLPMLKKRKNGENKEKNVCSVGKIMIESSRALNLFNYM